MLIKSGDISLLYHFSTILGFGASGFWAFINDAKLSSKFGRNKNGEQVFNEQGLGTAIAHVYANIWPPYDSSLSVDVSQGSTLCFVYNLT